MRLALFTECPENLPLTYVWEGVAVETFAGIALCQPFSKVRQATTRVIVVAYKDRAEPSNGYTVAWEADIVAVTRSASPYDTWGGSPRYDIFYAHARKLDAVPERAAGPGYIRYIE